MASIGHTATGVSHCPFVTQATNSEFEFQVLFYTLIFNTLCLPLTKGSSVKFKAIIRLHLAGLCVWIV